MHDAETETVEESEAVEKEAEATAGGDGCVAGHSWCNGSRVTRGEFTRASHLPCGACRAPREWDADDARALKRVGGESP